jgi:hypothetical protein
MVCLLEFLDKIASFDFDVNLLLLEQVFTNYVKHLVFMYDTEPFVHCILVQVPQWLLFAKALDIISPWQT